MSDTLPNFIKHLVTLGALDLDTAKTISKDALEHQTSIVDYIIENHLINALTLAQTLSQYFALPFTDLEEYESANISQDIISLQLMAQYQILPLKSNDKQLLLATANPTNSTAINAIKFHTGLDTKITIVEYDKLAQIIARLSGKQQLQNLEQNKSEDLQIIKLVEQFLNDAINQKASDIHFEPYEKIYRIRLRIDGILYPIADIAPNLAAPITSRLKVIANLNIAEHRLPQDGRFSLNLQSQPKRDCRISTCPTLYGEKIVIRILNSNYSALTIEQLGMEKSQTQIFLKHIHAPQGMILVTGPTGSGKTITLYTALNILNTAAKNISTIENPVEISLPGINQVEVNHKIGLDFATSLKAFLRQDPDIIMVGEIRDLETAQIAIRAAQTGHLVLSTLHTNSSVEALTRLINMGIAPFNLNSSINLIIAQRLLKTLCPYCKKPDPEKPCHYTTVGCNKCHNGYLRRCGVFELLPISKSIKQLIAQHADNNAIAEQAAKEAMLTLHAAAKLQLNRGITTQQEINRVLL